MCISHGDVKDNTSLLCHFSSWENLVMAHHLYYKSKNICISHPHFSESDQQSSLPRSTSGQSQDSSDKKPNPNLTSPVKERQSSSFFGRVSNISQV